MLILLNESLLWWHWIVFGIFLLTLEMLTGTFFMLGLGVGAIVVGGLDAWLTLSFTLELTIWMILSSIAIGLWFRYFRQKSVTTSGQSNHRLDTLGVVLEEIQPHSRGKVTFDTPVLGNTTWHATAKVDIDKNTRVQIVQINGQLIEVSPLQTS